METHTEQQLAGRLRRGDHSALSDLDQTYRHKIYQLALSYMKNHWDAEEVTQDVLFRVFRKIDTFRGDAALSSWIYRGAVFPDYVQYGDVPAPQRQVRPPDRDT